MTDASTDQSAGPSVEDIAPELSSRLQHLNHERSRCLEYAAKLSGWAMFWKILLVALGAFVAAQGAFVNVWGPTKWITVTFIMFGVLIALGSAFDALFRPAERSPKFAHMGFEYERLYRDLSFATSGLLRLVNKGDLDHRDDSFYGKIEDLAHQADSKLDALREREVALYVTGPVKVGYTRTSREKLWRRWSG